MMYHMDDVMLGWKLISFLCTHENDTYDNPNQYPATPMKKGR